MIKKNIFRVVKKTILVLISVFIFFNVIMILQSYKLTHFFDPPKQGIDTSNNHSFFSILAGLSYYKDINEPPPTVPFQNIELVTHDNEKLAAWYIPAAAAKGTILLYHGHGENKSKVLCQAMVFHKLHYNLLLTDFRAHGLSSGNLFSVGINEAADIKAGWDFIVQKGEKNILLYGISLGASTIINAVYEYHLKPNKVILDLPFASIFDAVQGKISSVGLPPNPLSFFVCLWGSIFIQHWAWGFKPYLYAKAIHCPTIIQEGFLDNRVKPSEIEAIFKNIQTNDKFIIIYARSSHENLCKKEYLKFFQVMSEFL